MMYFKYVWLLGLLLPAYLLYSNDYLNDDRFDFMNVWLRSIKNVYSNLVETSNINEKVFTSSELKKYTNLEDGLYISILGQVFDVTKGAKHYGPNATYHVFTGRDASLAFITGEFEGNSLTDDISSLSMQEVKVLHDWVQFYNKNYIYKGKLYGRYYNENGIPTEEFYNVQKILKHAKENEVQEENKKRMFPPCNIEWNPNFGTRVWCSKRSGGIERDWIGVPRKLFMPPDFQQYRCACVKLDSKEYEEAKGKLREYSECSRTAIECTVKTTKL